MKYVISKRGTILIPVVGPDIACHADLVVRGGKAVSAGWCVMHQSYAHVIPGFAESLGIGTKDKKHDEDVLALLANDYDQMNFFMDYDEFYGPAVIDDDMH